MSDHPEPRPILTETENDRPIWKAATALDAGRSFIAQLDIGGDYFHNRC